MRAVAILTALLLLLGPLAAAEGDSGSGSSAGSDSGSSSGPSDDSNSTSNSTEGSDGNSTSASNSTSPPPPPPAQCPMPERRPATEEELQACKDRYCREHPDQKPCRDERADEEAAGNASAGRGPREWQRWCRGEAREDSGRERCRGELARFGAGGQGQWISFQVDAANATLLDYEVAGHPVLDSLHLETGSDNLTVRATGAALRLGDADTELMLHDDPTGLVRLKGDDGSLLLVLPPGTRADRTDDGTVARLQYADGRVAHLRIGNATWLDGRTVLAEGFAALLVNPPEEKPGHDEQVQVEVKGAIEDRKVGAEITLHGPAAPGRAAAQGNSSVDVLAYDDVQVEVRMPSGAVATPDAPIRVEVSADLKEGRTIVLNVNRSLLEATDPQALVLRYFDLHEQADGSTLETEVVFHQAGSLQDVLDASNDSGQPEYWVVQDANGVQVLASVPHWSAHAITIGSLAVLHVTPNVAIGIVAGVAGSVVAAVAMLWPRRRMDE